MSAKDGAVSGYGKVAGEYLNALADLDEKLASADLGIQNIAADIKNRGSVIVDAGVALQQTFWKNLVLTLPFPVVYYEWLNVKNTGDSLAHIRSLMVDAPQLQHFLSEAGYIYGSMFGECSILASFVMNWPKLKLFWERGQHHDVPGMTAEVLVSPDQLKGSNPQSAAAAGIAANPSARCCL